MSTYHLSLSSFTLLLWAGSIFVAGLACVISSQVGTLVDHIKGRR